MTIYFLVGVGVGGLGVSGAPSPLIVDMLGQGATVLAYSSLLMLLGLVGAASVLRRSVRGVQWSLVGMSIATAIHGVAVVLAPGRPDQTGWRILMAIPLMLVVSAIWPTWML